MKQWDLEYTILEDIHQKTTVGYTSMLLFYCMKLMEHFKMNVELRDVDLNGRKYKINVEIMPEN